MTQPVHPRSFRAPLLSIVGASALGGCLLFSEDLTRNPAEQAGGAGGGGGSAGSGLVGGEGGTAGQGNEGGSVMPSFTGCSDGTRELFEGPELFPDIAGCSGGWSVPGVADLENFSPCGRLSGNDSPNPEGLGCSALDLCSPGFEICRDQAQVASHAQECETTDATAIWIMRAGAPPSMLNVCEGGTNNLIGCGAAMGTELTGCSPLNRQVSYDECEAVPPWECGSVDQNNIELEVVTKTGPEAGGVLCCRKPG